MLYKIDLHTHSVASPDGGITEKEYEDIITKKVLDYVAITDHNRIDFAQKMQAKLGDAIIVGEEIMTTGGEIIGLFLKEKIEPGLSLEATIEEVHKQNGLVYIPHPFDIFRKGIGKKIGPVASGVDIIEAFNGRIIVKSHNTKAQAFAQKHTILIGIGSDAHTGSTIGKTYALVEGKVTKASIKKQLQNAQFITHYQSWYGYFSPKWNRIKKFLG